MTLRLRIFVIHFFLLSLLAGTACRNVQLDSQNPIFLTDSLSMIPARLSELTDTFLAYRDGQLQGEMLVKTYEESGKWVVEEYTTTRHTNISERIISQLEADNFTQSTLSIRGSQGDNPIDVHLQWENMMLKGTSTYPREQSSHAIHIFDSLPQGILEQTALRYMLPAMTLKPAAEWPISWYNAQQARLTKGLLKTAVPDTITVPAGTFEVLPVDMLGDSPGQRVYISQTPPYRIVKLEALDVPWTFVLK